MAAMGRYASMLIHQTLHRPLPISTAYSRPSQTRRTASLLRVLRSGAPSVSESVRITLTRMAQGDFPYGTYLPSNAIPKVEMISKHYTPRIADITYLLNLFPALFRHIVLPRTVGVIRLVNSFEEGRMEHPTTMGFALKAQRMFAGRVKAVPLTFDVSAVGGDPVKVAEALRQIRHNFTNVFIDPESPYPHTHKVLDVSSTQTTTGNLEAAVYMHVHDTLPELSRPDLDRAEYADAIRHTAEFIHQLDGKRTADAIEEELKLLIRDFYQGGRLLFHDGLEAFGLGHIDPVVWGKTFTKHLRGVGMSHPDFHVYESSLGNCVYGEGSGILGINRWVRGEVVTDVVNNGKACLISCFGEGPAYHLSLPLELSPEEIAQIMIGLSCGFISYNQEDISDKGNKANEVYGLMTKHCPIYNFADDLFGTAIVTGCTMLVAQDPRFLNKPLAQMRGVVFGAGAAGGAITIQINDLGVSGDNLTVVDSKGAIFEGRPDLSGIKLEIAKRTNRAGRKGPIEDVIAGADFLVAMAGPDMLATREACIAKMAPRRLVILGGNPKPECDPELLDASGENGCERLILCTGMKMDSPKHGKTTQINNVLAFPGLLAAVRKARLRRHELSQNLLASRTIAACVTPERMNEGILTPKYVEDRTVHGKVREAIAAWEPT